ncbi:MAG: hypothetical protein NC336_04565 [Clostridium sp.]|nr:hypothetical protein [Clostridium sp.]
MKHNDFDIFFNLNAEDTYLVSYISQYLRDRGMTTFDRSVDRLPVTDAETLSEDDALAASRQMVYVLTENSLRDPSDEELLAKACRSGKKIVVMRFDGVDLPETLKECVVIDADRARLDPSLRRLESVVTA